MAQQFYFLGDDERAEKLAKELTSSAQGSFYGLLVLFMLTYQGISDPRLSVIGESLWVDVPLLMFGTFRADKQITKMLEIVQRMVNYFQQSWNSPHYDAVELWNKTNALMRMVAPQLEVIDESKLETRKVRKTLIQDLKDEARGARQLLHIKSG